MLPENNEAGRSKIWGGLGPVWQRAWWAHWWRRKSCSHCNLSVLPLPEGDQLWLLQLSAYWVIVQRALRDDADAHDVRNGENNYVKDLSIPAQSERNQQEQMLTASHQWSRKRAFLHNTGSTEAWLYCVMWNNCCVFWHIVGLWLWVKTHLPKEFRNLAQ